MTEIEKTATWDELNKLLPIFWPKLWNILENLNGEKTRRHDGANLNIWAAIHLLKKDIDSLSDMILECNEDLRSIKKKLRKSVFTPLQIEVLSLVREGKKTKEIAEKLHLTEERISNIKRRLKELESINER